MSPSEDEAVNNGAEQEPANFEDETPTDDTKSLLLALPTELQILIVENVYSPNLRPTR